MHSLILRYKAEDDWHGELSAIIACGDFTGRGAAWFNISDLMAFARSIEAYPIDTGSAPDLVGGTWKDKGTLDRATVHIRIEPIGHRGLLRVTVEVATNDNSPDFSGDLRVELSVTYRDLANFQSSLAQHLSGRSAEATLERS
ncbi:hypothetical protein [Rhizobium sp. SYY.PMSO]|uniref:hypothetical protein n=1 Tax=Rhizobium sp. SYY.PMSO TaxID=3382192 RepID=UPI0039900D98